MMKFEEKIPTEKCVLASGLYSGGASFECPPRHSLILTEVFRSFPQSFQANAGIIS
jgi:hypothetical protein